MLIACVGLYGERVEQAMKCITRLIPYVDRYIVIVDETVTDEQRTVLKDSGCEVYFHPWEDSMIKMRNQYLEKVQTDDWVIVHDPDECFNEQFCKDVRKLCETADKQGIVLMLINSHDTTILKDGSEDSSISDFFKNLIFKKVADARYEGVGEVKEVHETLILPGQVKVTRLPADQYWYNHIKYWHEVWERAARNVFIAGGGNNIGEGNVAWKPLREICRNVGMDTWTEVREYLRKGNVMPLLKDWLWTNRYEGFDYHHEMMEFGRWYFDYLHPNEKEFADGRVWAPVHELKPDSPPEVMRFVEQTYMAILGRHADQDSKTAYTQAIIDGAIQRADLPTILRQSSEYQEKTGDVGENVKIRVPVQAQIVLTEELFLEAMMKSKTYWETIKPMMDIMKFIRTSLSKEDWEEFVKLFYSTKPSIDDLLWVLINITGSRRSE